MKIGLGVSVYHRILSQAVVPFTLSEIVNTDGATITETNVGPLTIQVRSTSFQVSPYVSGYIKVNNNTLVTTTDGSRGHTLAVIDSEGSTVGSVDDYDTYGDTPTISKNSLASLTSALNTVVEGNYVALASWDACAVNEGLRDILRNSFGATLTTTWAPTRYSHIFIGKKLVPPATVYIDPSNSISYPGSGTTLTNLVNTGLNATTSNVSFTDPYLSYNGTSSTVSIPDNDNLEPGTGDFSVEIWVNPSVIGTTGRVLIGKTDTGLASGWGYGLRMNTDGRVYFEVGNGTTSLTSPSTTLSTDNWYQVVGVWSNVNSKLIGLYVNGQFIGSNSHSFTSIKNTTSPLYLGSFNGGQFNQWFNGKIGITKVYKSALTSDQVLQSYNLNKDSY